MAAPKGWNKTAGFEMWKAGKSDKEIAEAVGVTASAVCVHRKKYWEHKREKTKPTTMEQKETEAAKEPLINEKLADTAEDAIHVETAPTGDCCEPSDLTGSQAETLFSALEVIVEGRSGMDAVLTAQVVLAIANWESAEDLKEARMVLNHMIERCCR